MIAPTEPRLTLVEAISICVPTGLAIGILLLFALGLIGMFTLPAVVVTAGTVLGIAGWRLRGQMARLHPSSETAFISRRSAARLAMGLIACGLLAPVALNALTPPLASDEVRYHLPYALQFVEQGRIAPDLHLRYPFFTLNVNLLYAAGLLFGNDLTPHFLHLLLGALAGLALYVLATPVCGRLVAFCGAMLFFATPNLQMYAATAYIDLGVAAFFMATLVCLDRAARRPPLLLCAGLACGAALGSKYLALALFPLLVAWAAYRLRSKTAVMRFATVAVLSGACWYVYNLIWTGNPVSPFAGEWFGTWPWENEDLASQTRQLTNSSRESNLADLFKLPYELVTEPGRFTTLEVPALVSVGLVALLLTPWRKSRIRPYGLLVLVIVVGWFFTAPFFRYLTPVLPLLCLISAWSVERIFLLAAGLGARVRGPRVLKASMARLAAFAAAATVLMLAGQHVLEHSRWLHHDALTERVEHRDRFLRERLPEYGVVEHLEREGAKGEVVFAVPPNALYSYVRANRIVGDYFGLMAISRTTVPYRECMDQLADRLRARGISMFAVFPEPKREQGWMTRLEEQLGSRLPVAYSDEHGSLFRVAPATGADHGRSWSDAWAARHNRGALNHKGCE